MRLFATAVAGKALGVIRNGLMLRILVGVVAGETTYAAITRIEATAFGQAVRLEADGWDPPGVNRFHVRSGPVAGAAEPHLISGRQSAGIKNMGLPQFPGLHGARVLGPWTMAAFA